MSENPYHDKLLYCIEQKAKKDNELRQLERAASANQQFETIRMMHMLKSSGKL